MSKLPFTELQPKDGDLIAHCGHTADSPPHHFFKVDGARLQRPDGSWFEPSWFVLCSSCFAEHRHHPHMALRGDSIWIGDEPEIRNNHQ